jgi:IclR family pca regulon transcriptional regulator
MPDTHKTYRLESLARGLAVLSSFSTENPALSLTDISQQLSMHKTTALRILSTLEGLGYVKRDPQTKLYRPSLAVFKLGFVVLDSLEVRQIAGPYLKRLAKSADETVNLVVLDEADVVYIDRVTSNHAVVSHRPIGSRLPVYCTSTGKALLACLPANDLDRILQRVTWEKFAETTLTTPDALRQDLAQVRRQGFATSNGEMIPELRAVAAPIYQSNGQVIAAVNISVPAHRASFDDLVQKLAPQAVDAARQISEALGYSTDNRD